VGSATHDVETQCGAGGQPKVHLTRTHTKLQCRCYMRGWSEPVDLRLVLAQTKYIWSLAPVEPHVNNATHDVVTQQCGAGGQPKVDFLNSHSRL